ncbi:hypothetical protein L1F30_11930 [Simiduia sp. 21SJ11W-1]|uniref:hypothetical protein n=1 Tax=Simiduia sp. 21SJ11W-1 TaxID=2909669 RepID=UPI00209EE239|nr:hypothetical protein [Simiduia sp. 21SJ11W-1]UTA46870.1 hypothetical protein L1F30_11930 [Simiduia sp. 21SJ11W-1]
MWPFSSEKNPAKPSFNSARKYSIRLPTCTLSFLAPKPEGENIPSDFDYSEIQSTSEAFDDLLNTFGELVNRFVDLFGSSWSMKGVPLISHSVGSVGFSIRLIETPWLGVNESLFCPKVLVDCLQKEFSFLSKNRTYSLAPESNRDLNDYHVPKELDMLGCHWTILSGCPVLYKESINLRDSVNDVEYIVPIDDNRYLRIAGHLWRNVNNAGNYIRADQRVPLEPFKEVVDEIVKSISITPTPKLAAGIAMLSASLKKSAPRLSPSPEYVYLAKSALKRASAFSFRPKPNQPNEVSAVEASGVIDALLTTRAMPGPFPSDGPVTFVHPDADLSPVPLSFRKEVPPPA